MLLALWASSKVSELDLNPGPWAQSSEHCLKPGCFSQEIGCHCCSLRLLSTLGSIVLIIMSSDLTQHENGAAEWDDTCKYILLFLFFFNFSIILLLFNYSCLHFLPPLYPTPAKPTFLPCFHPPPWFCPCVLYSSSWKPFSPLSLPPSPLAIVRLFLTSMSLVIFSLLFSSVDYVPVKGEIIRFLKCIFWRNQSTRMLIDF